MSSDPSSRRDPLDRAALVPVLAQLPATVWATDSHLTVTFIEGELLRRLGVPADRIVGRRLPDLLLDGREDHPLIQGHLTALSGAENTVRIEWGGDIISARLAPLRDAAGEIVGCVGVQQTIGWVPDLDGTLRESEVRLRRAVDENPAGVVFSNGDGQITDANDAFLQMAGRTREDLVTDELSWPALLPVEEHHREVAALDEIAATGRCAPFETRIIRRDGRHIPVIVSGARLSARRREGVAFVIDISAWRDTERRLRAELACQSAVLAGPSIEGAAAAVLDVLCRDLDWMGAALWEPTPLGVRSHLIAGTNDDMAAIASLARRVVAGREPLWNAAARTLVVPLGILGRGGALSVVSRTSETPDDETIALITRVAALL